MATYTERIASAPTTPGTSAATTAAFTPSNNSLLCVVAMGMDFNGVTMTGNDLTISDSLTSTWTSRAVTGAPPTWAYGIRAWTTPITTGASMTVSIDCGTFYMQDVMIWVFDVTGYNTSSPIGGTAVGTDADGNGVGSITLSAAPDAADIVAAAVMVQQGGAGSITHGTGWTEVNEGGESDWFRGQFQRITGVTSTTVQWDDLNASGGTPVDAVMLAFVIKDAGGGGSPAEAYLTMPPMSPPMGARR